MKISLILFYLLLGSTLIGYSQSDEAAYENKFAVGLSLGTSGGGIDVARNFSRFNIALGFNYLEVKDLKRTLTVQGELMDTKLSTSAFNIDLKAEYLPFKKSSFKLFAGIAYLPQSNVEVKGMYANQVQVGELVFTQEEIGEIYFKGDWANFAPYFGLGFGRAVPKRRIGVAFDMGVYYMGNPKVTFTGTNMFSDLNSQEEQLQKNLEGYSWLPILKLRLSYRIN
ncbi:hypothetical protein [Flammeovirga aprica]|uniref:Outer membrane protein beta-barrel domain-containing protein n=1 Tax=Flammeovirga aprica JL-4 TaxID=694437 RepID=A0A7X9P3C8_9BACT|nr:hypothetical protein [Flammeovirga aprica]NME68272.1 hypothetical protein [Flammeovirga aprica JL-4]